MLEERTDREYSEKYAQKYLEEYLMTYPAAKTSTESSRSPRGSDGTGFQGESCHEAYEGLLTLSSWQ